MWLLDDVRVDLVHDVESAQNFLRWLSERRRVLAIDTETGGLEVFKQPLRLVQFGDTLQGWAVPWADWGGLIRDVIRRYDGPVVMHNAKFDQHFLWRHGCEVPWDRVHDTVLKAAIANPHRGKALKSLCAALIDKRAPVGQKILDIAKDAQGWDWLTVPTDFWGYWGYGALDTVIDARLDEVLDAELDADARRVYELERQVQMIVAQIERNGMHVDLEHCRLRCAELRMFVDEATLWVSMNYGVSVTSDVELIEVFKRLGVTFVKRTKSGAREALDKEVLEWVMMTAPCAEAHELARVVLGVRRCIKTMSTYLENFEEIADTNDIMHADINTLGTVTGRMTGGIFQTLPRGKGPVRDAFNSRYPGGRVVTSDYDQIEMRLLAHFADEPGLKAAIASGDVHTETARLVYQDPNLTKDDPRRHTAKNAAFAKIYMAGVEKFALTAGVDVEVAREFLSAYDERFPGVRTFQLHVDAVANMRLIADGEAWVRTPLGRRQVARRNEKLYALVNYLIQGTAADVLKQRLVALHMADLTQYVTLLVHDEVVSDVPPDVLDDVVNLLPQVMGDTESFSVPITAGIDVMERWGDKYAYSA